MRLALGNKKRPILPVSKQDWEAQYKSGYWMYLNDLHEAPRYAVLGVLLQSLGANGSIVDIGCGTGILLRHLRMVGYNRYLGIDISEHAIREADQFRDSKTEFVAANVEHFVPVGPFNSAVFNECLYYLSDPLAVVDRYTKALQCNGIFITSVFKSSVRKMMMVRKLERLYRIIERVR